jgi:hypothetical protein
MLGIFSPREKLNSRRSLGSGEPGGLRGARTVRACLLIVSDSSREAAACYILVKDLAAEKTLKDRRKKAPALASPTP